MAAAGQQLNMLQLYRQILKAAKHFPSVKKHSIIKTIKDEFRENRVSWTCLLLAVLNTKSSSTAVVAAAATSHAAVSLTCAPGTHIDLLLLCEHMEWSTGSMLVIVAGICCPGVCIAVSGGLYAMCIQATRDSVSLE
jgi:hypothetical protein